MDNSTSASGTKVKEHPHKEIDIYKFTKEEIYYVTNIEDEKRWYTIFEILLGSLVSCVITASICYLRSDDIYLYYIFVIIVLAFFSTFSWNEYRRLSKVRISKLNELLNDEADN